MSLLTYDDNSLCENNEPVSSAQRTAEDDQVKIQRQEELKRLFAFLSPSNDSINNCKPSTSLASQPKAIEQYSMTVCAVELVLPVKPYTCQMAVISKVLHSIKESMNCLVESPTGTGKTLALLCAALAWQRQEKKRITKQKMDVDFERNPDLKKAHDSTATNTASPQKNTSESEIQFVKPIHGDRSIYDIPIEDCNFSYAESPKKTLNYSNGSDGIVGITKKVPVPQASTSCHSDLNKTNYQNQNTDNDVTREAILPVIYYGARTHKQLEQVVQEFARTAYAKEAPMSILSSRDFSCIREFDKKMWPSKNDMCRSCTKSSSSDSESKCKFYTNYKALNHRILPPAFDIKKLISEGKKLVSCPYYAAKKMARDAQIVFCPYNYLIDPSIRSSMNIDINNNIIIIDEGHNIEDVCREVASYTFKQIEIFDALKELNTATSFRFANNDGVDCIDYLHTVLNEWSSWFYNQKPLVDNLPVNDGTAEHLWEVGNFLDTLNNHNIGLKDYPAFSETAKIFCRNVRDDPRKMVGITQATGTLIENLDTVFGYLFRNSGKNIEDYKPVLVRKLLSPYTGRTKSEFDTVAKSESLSLSLLCLNPGVVFSSLHSARCVVLASGTLTPMSSLHSELDTVFGKPASPRDHVIKKDRVWVGSLGGRWLLCNSENTRRPDVQDALGRVLHHVCEVTPHGVLCFLPSYHLMNLLYTRWESTKLWNKLKILKDVFRESKRMEEHEIIMSKYYKSVQKSRGALLLAVYRGKVAEGMDFKDHQARAVVAVGVPYPAQFKEVKEKMKYNDKYAKDRHLLTGSEWLKVQAYRALNQAVGRVVRHAGDWGAVLLVDRRYAQRDYCTHLANWVRDRLGDNHNDFDTFCDEDNGLKEFMERMKSEE